MRTESENAPGRSPAIPAGDSTSREIQVATQLIIEYTQRLLDACRAATRQQMRRTALLGLVFACTSAAVLAWESMGLRLEVIFGLAGIVLAISAIGPLSVRGSTLARDEVRLTARGLAVLVRYASEVYEHKLVDIAERLLLEVRLGEAEAALEISVRYGARTWKTEKSMTLSINNDLEERDPLPSTPRIPAEHLQT